MPRGRKMSPRSVELTQMLDKAKPGETIAIELTEGEQEKFVGFSQRVRHIAKTLGRSISVSHTKYRPNIAVVTVEPKNNPEHPNPTTEPEPAAPEPEPEPYVAAVPPATPNDVAVPPLGLTLGEMVERDASIKRDMLAISESLKDIEARIAWMNYQTVFCQALLRSATLSVRQACDIWERVCACDADHEA